MYFGWVNEEEGVEPAGSGDSSARGGLRCMLHRFKLKWPAS